MGKIEDMLASGRAPMVLVRGAAWEKPVDATAPIESVLSDREIRERQELQNKEIRRRGKVDAELRAATRMSKKKPPIRRVASMGLESFIGMQQRMGEDISDQSAVARSLKDAGYDVDL